MGSEKDQTALVDQFATSVILRFDAKTSEVKNRHALDQLSAFETIVARYGNVGREALSVLLHHDDPRVRCSAAAFLLRYMTDECMEVLNELKSGRGLVALAAECTIMNWENGDWELDPGEE